MRKWIWILLLLFISACGTDQQTTSSDLETLTHHDEQKGLTLEATINIGKDIIIDASITNTSGETITYNDGCGIPFGIVIKKEDAHSHLINLNGEEESCFPTFTPDDLTEMESNETFEKEVTFKREVELTNNSTTTALIGVYEVSFSFGTHENGDFVSSLPIKLTSDEEPEILTREQVIEKAKQNEEVETWFNEQETKGISIETEDGILSEGMWTVAFHAIDQDKANRIIINMHAKTGEVKAVHYEELEEEVLEFLEDK
ncbi:hypothetical protein NC661_19415 [Aquibacillus koreensis]|uniref:Uncharacterized protein n=1 Tax=Aquibacillus koreensis TaxID=279446 RepID=A0A9X3WMR1_9BACI|nr:hypothetical protein [Aquibacillus koreensis]MCT2535360.1 hypothetical protein [Aquibacillus koreensis]MDC3422525.1 hypothetical protein [Aquibacillus koreensis]